MSFKSTVRKAVSAVHFVRHKKPHFAERRDPGISSIEAIAHEQPRKMHPNPRSSKP